MKTEQSPSSGPSIQSKCATCGLRLRSEKNPKTLMARLWRWHTTWCPGWKKYQRELAALGIKQP